MMGSSRPRSAVVDVAGPRAEAATRSSRGTEVATRSKALTSLQLSEGSRPSLVFSRLCVLSLFSVLGCNRWNGWHELEQVFH